MIRWPISYLICPAPQAWYQTPNFLKTIVPEAISSNKTQNFLTICLLLFKKKMAAELQVQLMNELLRDNDALTKAVSIATREKAELGRAVSLLEKTLKHHTQKGCLLNVGIFVSSWRSTCPLSLYHSAVSHLSVQ